MSSFGGSSISRRARHSALDEASRKIVEPAVTSCAARAAIASLAAAACSTRWDQAVAIARAATRLGLRERPGAPVHALDEALAGKLLEVPVHRDRGHRVTSREFGDGYAAVALDALQHLGSAECGRHGGQTRSSNARLVTLTSTRRNSSIALTRWSAKRVSASSPFSGVARIGFPITPVRENSAWSIGNTKYW